MKNDVNIKVTGGNINIGNISQGNNNSNTVGNQSNNSNIENDLESILNYLDEKAKDHSINQEQILSLKAELSALKDSYQTNPSGIFDIIEELKNKYSWASDVIMKVATLFTV
ncbi:MAG: hypothetical protein GXO85_00400 [Chlorobi bacterium]|nr:hypothetical protein [Chlorobiota bacterium]